LFVDLGRKLAELLRPVDLDGREVFNVETGDPEQRFDLRSTCKSPFARAPKEPAAPASPAPHE